MTFKIFGVPFAKQSFKFSKSGHKYQPAEVVRQANNIRAQIVNQIPPEFYPLSDPLKMTVSFIFPWPKMTKKDYNARMVCQNFYKWTKPDIDNMLKNLWDSMQGVVFLNDSQIVEVKASKLFGNIPRTEIFIEEV